MSKEKEQKVEHKKTLTFHCEMLGEVEVNRETLVTKLLHEERSYANFPFSIGNNRSFMLPEIKEKYPKGIKAGFVVNIADNLGKRGSKEITEI